MKIEAKPRSSFEDPKLEFDERGFIKHRLYHPNQILRQYQENNIVGKTKDRKEFLSRVASNLISDPEYCDLFFNYSNEWGCQHPEDTKDFEQIKSILFSSYLENTAEGQQTVAITDSQLLGFMKMSIGKIPDTNRDKITASTRILRGFVKGTLDPQLKGKSPNQIYQKTQSPEDPNPTKNALQETQTRITNLLYRLTLLVLESQDEDLYKRLNDIMVYKTCLLEKSNYQALLLSLGSFSLSDEVISQHVPLNYVMALFSAMYYPEADTLAKDAVALPISIEKNKPIALSYLKMAQQFPDRLQAIEDWQIHRTSALESFTADNIPKLAEVKDESIDELLEPLSFPDDSIYKVQDKFWFYYNDLVSRYFMQKGLIQGPFSAIVLPDGRVRTISVKEGKNDIVATKIMKKSLETGQGGEITNHFVIDSALGFLKPKFNVDKMREELIINTEKVKNPVRGINKKGVFNDINDSDIAASSIFFDSSGSRITITIGNYQIPLYLNDHYELCYYDSKQPIEVDQKTKIWWETIIISTLKVLIYPEKEDDVLITGTEDLTIEEAVKETKKRFFDRIGFLRQLPSNHGYTEEQRYKTLEIRFPLPKIETLDLKTLNVERDLIREKGQLTYVLPIEKKEEDSTPPHIRSPHAFDEVKKNIIKTEQ